MPNRLVASAELDTNVYNTLTKILDYLDTLPNNCYINIINIMNFNNIPNKLIIMPKESFEPGTGTFSNGSLGILHTHDYRIGYLNGILSKIQESSRREYYILCNYSYATFIDEDEQIHFFGLSAIRFSETESKIIIEGMELF